MAKEHPTPPQHEPPQGAAGHGKTPHPADAMGGEGSGSTGTGRTGSTNRSSGAGELSRETAGVERDESLQPASRKDMEQSEELQDDSRPGDLGRPLGEEVDKSQLQVE